MISVIKALFGRYKLIGVATLMGLVMNNAGCSTVLAAKTPEEQVQERAQARWNAIFDDKVEASYLLTAPSYRTIVDYKIYRAKHGGGGGVMKQGAKVYRVYCSSSALCKAVIELEYISILGPAAGKMAKTAYEESWVLEAGEWWYYPR